MGSPTVPSRRRLLRLRAYRLLAFARDGADGGGRRVEDGHPYLSTTSQKRPQSGYCGTPSNITLVAPLASGPYTT